MDRRWIRELCLGLTLKRDEVPVVRWHKCGFIRVTSVLKRTLGYGLKIKESEDPGGAKKGREPSAVEHCSCR